MPDLLHFALTALVILGGQQDWRRREVSNWITIPLFLLGLAGAAGWWLCGHLPIPALAILSFLLFWRLGWLGGADVKILAGLWGLWPLGGLAAILGLGLWGLLAILLRRSPSIRIPGVVAMAFATGLTFLLEIAIMPSN